MTNGSLSEKIGRLSGQLDQLIPTLEKVVTKTNANTTAIEVIKTKIAEIKTEIESIKETQVEDAKKSKELYQKVLNLLVKYILPAVIAAVAGGSIGASINS